MLNELPLRLCFSAIQPEHPVLYTNYPIESTCSHEADIHYPSCKFYLTNR